MAVVGEQKLGGEKWCFIAFVVYLKTVLFDVILLKYTFKDYFL